MEKRDFAFVWSLIGSFASALRERFGAFEVHIFADCVEIYLDRLSVIKEIPDYSQDYFRIFSNDAGVVTLVLSYEFDSDF